MRSGRRPSRAGLRIAVAIALLALAAWPLLRYRLFFHPDAYLLRVQTGALQRILDRETPDLPEPSAVARFHQGEPPCQLAAPPATAEEIDAALQAIDAAGLGDMLASNVVPLALLWAHEDERRRHGEPGAEELRLGLRALGEPAWRAWLVVALNRRRLAEAMEAFVRANLGKEAAAAEKRLGPEGVRQVRGIWERHRAALVLPSAMKLLHAWERTGTLRRMERLAAAWRAWHDGHGMAPPDLETVARAQRPHLELRDGWYQPILLEWPGPRLVSQGRDRAPGGEGDDADLFVEVAPP